MLLGVQLQVSNLMETNMIHDRPGYQHGFRIADCDRFFVALTVTEALPRR